ncbi:MAG TPA: hypothetical protein VMS64_17495 [Candidatus Methylomirabilis sp.]|nr:hypothetical protein [Candidatus Methylomirabilis sp.]
MNRLTAVTLVAIAVLLAVIAFHPVTFAPASSAAAGAIEYKIVRLSPQFAGNSEAVLNQMGAQGWEIAYGVGEYIVMKRSK